MILPTHPPKFQPGEKVVCINDKNFDVRLYAYHLPVEEKTYTVRAVIWAPSIGRYGILLEEIVNRPLEGKDGGFEPFFNEERFRKIDEIDSLLTNILEDVKEEELEDAVV